jgi:hypothetical protein
LNAFARLTSTDLGGLLEAMGQSFSDFLPPADFVGNPRELAVEAGCYSNSETASYVVQSSADESRTIRLGLGDAEFDADGTASVRSEFFVTGAMLLWSLDPTALADVQGAARLSVMNEATGMAVFSSEIIVRTTLDAGAELTSDGPVVARIVGLDELAELGADPASLDVLRELEEQGQLLIVAIPSQSRNYDFEVVADEPATLRARIEIELENTTGQTGIAATIGRPFSNLAAFIHSALPEVDGASLQTALNKAMARAADAPGEPPGPRPPSGGICGAMGAGPVLLLFGLSLWLFAARTRRPAP